ncbi:hypothetical protein D3C81_1407440 [compost metagenome]
MSLSEEAWRDKIKFRLPKLVRMVSTIMPNTFCCAMYEYLSLYSSSICSFKSALTKPKYSPLGKPASHNFLTTDLIFDSESVGVAAGMIFDASIQFSKPCMRRIKGEVLPSFRVPFVMARSRLVFSSVSRSVTSWLSVVDFMARAVPETSAPFENSSIVLVSSALPDG